MSSTTEAPSRSDPVGLDRGKPLLLLDEQDRVAHTLVDVEPEGVVAIAVPEGLEEAQRRPGRVGAHEDAVDHVVRYVPRVVAFPIGIRQLGESLVEDLHVVRRVVRGRVARTEHPDSASPVSSR